MPHKRQRASKRAFIIIAAFGMAFFLPLGLWLTFPSAKSPVIAHATATPQIIRVDPTDGEAIPVDWQAPELNPELEQAIGAFVDTLPLSETVNLTSTIVLSDTPALAVPVAGDVTAWNGLVASEALNVRDGPGGTYLRLTTVPLNATLTVIGQANGWYQVQTSTGILGWVDANFVAIGGDKTDVPTITDIPDPNPTLTAWVAVDAANLRSGPSRTSSVLDVLGATNVTLLTRRNDWYNVKTANGTYGWLSAEVVTTSAFIARRVPVLRANPNALESVRIASNYIGYPYVWGAAHPSEGFDCSGLVKYVLGRQGVDVPHGSIEQWESGIGIKIYNQADLLPGDIIYFKNTWRRGISHVGFYAGDGMVVQAISTGNGVSVVSMYEDYWIPRYVGAIRIFQ